LCCNSLIKGCVKLKYFPVTPTSRQGIFIARTSRRSLAPFPSFCAAWINSYTASLAVCNCFIIVLVEEKCECTWCLVSLNYTSDALLPYNAGSREISQSIMCVITTPIFLFKGQLWGTKRASKRR
jgi:hypothetical protein